MNLGKTGNVIFRRIRGRIIPIYNQHSTAVNVGAAAATFVGASVAAEKSRNAIAGKVYYKGRKGFNNGIANFVYDSAIIAGITYGAARKFPAVSKGFQTISRFMRSRSF